MSVYAVGMVKDEADVIGETAGWMVSQVDHVIIADNLSTDGTAEILTDLGIEVVEDPEVGYTQARKMTRLARLCFERGADWVVPFDADEVHMGEGRIADILGSLPDDVLISEAPLFDHVATGHDPEDSPVRRMGYRRPSPAPLRKVAVRASVDLLIDQGNHSARYPDNPHPKTVTNALEVRHFPYRSVEQFVSKVKNGAAAYAASDLPESVGAHWRQYGRILDEQGEAGIAEIFHRWYYREDPTEPIVIGNESQPPLVFDPCQLS